MLEASLFIWDLLGFPQNKPSASDPRLHEAPLLQVGLFDHRLEDEAIGSAERSAARPWMRAEGDSKPPLREGSLEIEIQSLK